MNMAMVRGENRTGRPGPMAAMLHSTMAMAKALRIPRRSVSRPAIRNPMAYATWNAPVIQLYSTVVKPMTFSRYVSRKPMMPRST